MHFQLRVSTTAVHELLSTDNCELNTTSEEDMQRSMGIFAAVAAACDNLGLSINMTKRVVIHQPQPNAAYNATQMNLSGAQLQVMDNFTYLDRPISRTTKSDDEVAHRISTTSRVFGRPYNTVWNRHGLRLSIKQKMCKAVILPTLLYGAETWKVYKEQAWRLSQYYLSCLRRILKLRWQNRIPDIDVPQWTGILDIYVMLRQLQLQSSGQLVQMDDERPPKRLFYGDAARGSCRHGDEVRRDMDTLKNSLRRLPINSINLEDLTQDRPSWRSIVNTGTAIYEANHIIAAKAKHEARKSQLRPARNANAQPSSTYPGCQRTFRAPIGFMRHLRANCSTRNTSAAVPALNSVSSTTLTTNTDRTLETPLSSSSSSIVLSCTAPAPLLTTPAHN
nr:unnamed protein product [Spirometra erinaceieuropaei]